MLKKNNSFNFLLTSKRPLVFVGQRDTFILRDKKKDGVAHDKWLTIGTDAEDEPLVLRL